MSDSGSNEGDLPQQPDQQKAKDKGLLESIGVKIRSVEEVDKELEQEGEKDFGELYKFPKGYETFEVEFGDTLEPTLEENGWSKEQIDNRVFQLAAKLTDRDILKPRVFWEDREIFWVSLPPKEEKDFDYKERISKGIVDMVRNPLAVGEAQELGSWVIIR